MTTTLHLPPTKGSGGSGQEPPASDSAEAKTTRVTECPFHGTTRVPDKRAARAAVQVDWNDLVHRTRPELCSRAMVILDHPADAADVADATLARLARHVDRHDWGVFGFTPGVEVDLTMQTVPVMRLWAWLYRVTRNLAQNVRKARAWEVHDPEDPFLYQTLSPDLDPERLLLQRIQRARIRRVLKRIGRRNAQLLLLHDYHRKSYAEIAVRFGLNQATAHRSVSRARARFREVWYELGYGEVTLG